MTSTNSSSATLRASVFFQLIALIFGLVFVTGTAHADSTLVRQTVRIVPGASTAEIQLTRTTTQLRVLEEAANGPTELAGSRVARPFQLSGRRASARTTGPKLMATNTPGALVEEGTYVVKTAQGEYVGQSGAISRRLQQHVASGKFTQAEVDAAERAMVTGGKLQREIAEQLLIDSKGGIDGLLNKVNPIGPKRVPVMPNQPYKR